MSFFAAFIKNDSKHNLINRFQKQIPKEFEVIADHMTIHMGKAKPEEEHLIGKFIDLTVDAIASDENVVAVRVIPWEVSSKNKVPHITLAINRNIGAKPAMSKNLTNWQKLDNPFNIRAEIRNSS